MKHDERSPDQSAPACSSGLPLILSILLISLVLGGGSVWVYDDYQYGNVILRLETETAELHTCETKIKLFRNIENRLQDIVALSATYQKKLRTHLKDGAFNTDRTFTYLQEELKRLKQQYTDSEEKLAKIENRAIRPLDLSFQTSATE